MHYKIALLFLLGITAINARVIVRFNYPTYNSQALGDLRLPLGVEEPSRHLLPPFEDYGGAQLYSNGIFKSVQPDWQLANKRQETEPQPYPYDVINRVLPEVKEPTDFQPLEQQITQIADNVKNVKQSVNDFENYLRGVAATLTPQNKAKSGVLRITMELAPKLGKVPISSLAEKDFANSISSILVEDSANSEIAKREKEFEKFLSSLFGEDSTESKSPKEAPEIVNILQNKNIGSFDGDIIEEESLKMEKELENLLSSIIEEDVAKSEKEFGNIDSFDDYKELENLYSSMIREDNTDSNGANDLSQKANKHNDDEEEIDESLDSFLNNIFAAEAREEEEEEIDEKIEKATAEAREEDEEEEKDEEIEKATADLDDKDLEESDGFDYLNSLFASSPSLNDDYFIR